MIITSSLYKKYCTSFILMFSVVAFSIFFSSTGHTKEVVSGRYVSITGNQIEFIVNVGIPTPANLIIQHIHPAQTKIISTIPRANKVNSSEGTVKWFLKSIEAGEIPLTLTFNKNVTENSVKAILRYRDPESGNFTESIILP